MIGNAVLLGVPIGLNVMVFRHGKLSTRCSLVHNSYTVTLHDRSWDE